MQTSGKIAAGVVTLVLVAAIVIFIFVLVHQHQNAQKQVARKPFSVLLADSICTQAFNPCTVWYSDQQSNGGLYDSSTSPVFLDPNIASAPLLFWQGPFGAKSSILGLAVNIPNANTNSLLTSTNAGLDWEGLNPNYNPSAPILLDGVLFDIDGNNNNLCSSSNFVDFACGSTATNYDTLEYKGQNTFWGQVMNGTNQYDVLSISTLDGDMNFFTIGTQTFLAASNASGAIFKNDALPSTQTIFMLSSNTAIPTVTSFQLGDETNTGIDFARWGETSWLFLGSSGADQRLVAFESSEKGLLTTAKQIPVQFAQPAECSANPSSGYCYFWQGLYGDARGWVAIAAQNNGSQSKVFSYIRGDKDGLRITNACSNCWLSDVRPLD